MTSSSSSLPSAGIRTTSSPSSTSSSLPSPMTFDHLYRQTAAACQSQSQSQSQSENDINTDTTSDIQNHHSISNSNSKSMHNSRTQVLLLGAAIGNLCTQIVCLAPLDRAPITASTHDTDTDTDNDHPDPFWNQPSPSRQTIYTSIAKIFQSILLLAHTTHLNNNGNDNGNGIDNGIDNDNINKNNNLQSSILKKMDLNARKYPVHLCKGKSGKYTEYSKETGITVENQSLRDIDLSNCVSINDNDTSASASASINNDTSLNLSLNLENLDLNLSCLENDDDDGNDDGHDGDIDISKDQLQLLPRTVSELSVMIREFAMDRNWSTYHTPRNIVLAMMGEMGELAEIFQWEGDCDSQLQLQLNGVNSWPEDKKDHLEQELADVSIYCLRLADVVGIRDLGLLVHDLFVGDAAGDGDGDGNGDGK